MAFKPEFIYTPQPPMGGKVYLVDRPGLFVLEVGPGTLITDACTHAGGGAMRILDGVPNDDGYFPALPQAIDFPTPSDYREAFGRRHGRELLRKSPVVMGSWMLNGGFHHGLTIEVSGAHDGCVAPVASIVWMPFRGKVA